MDRQATIGFILIGVVIFAWMLLQAPSTPPPPQGGAVNLGEAWPARWEQTQEPGLYLFRFTRPGGEVVEIASGANAGDETESDLRLRAWALAVSGEGGAGGGLLPAESPEAGRQIDLRPWLLAAAILLMLVEATLAWHR